MITNQTNEGHISDVISVCANIGFYQAMQNKEIRNKNCAESVF